VVVAAAGSGEPVTRGGGELVGEHASSEWERHWGLDGQELTVSGYPQRCGPSRGGCRWLAIGEVEDADEVVCEHHTVEAKVGYVETAPDRGWRRLSMGKYAHGAEENRCRGCRLQSMASG
jgi:hypothetical protein